MSSYNHIFLVSTFTVTTVIHLMMLGLPERIQCGRGNGNFDFLIVDKDPQVSI